MSLLLYRDSWSYFIFVSGLIKKQGKRSTESIPKQKLLFFFSNRRITEEGSYSSTTPHFWLHISEHLCFSFINFSFPFCASVFASLAVKAYGIVLTNITAPQADFQGLFSSERAKKPKQTAPLKRHSPEVPPTQAVAAQRHLPRQIA